MPPKGIGSGPRKPTVKAKKTTRGPQGLPTQASSIQKPATPPSRKRPAPKVQPGPISNAERKTIAKAKAQPEYKQKVRATRTERKAREAAQRATATRTGMADADRRRADEFKATARFKRDLAAAKPKKDDKSLLELAGESIVKNTPLESIVVGTKARKEVNKRIPGDVGRAIRGADRQITRELEGKGEIVKQSGKLAGLVGKHGLIVPTSTGDSTVGNVRGRNRIAAARPVKLSRAPVAERTIKDFINFPATAVPSIYVPVAGTVEAAQGNPKRIKQFAKDVKDTSVVYNVATGKFKKAGKLAKEHPGFAALEVAGAKGTAGRTAGRAMRAVSGPTRKLASTKRAPKTLPGTDLKEPREYSPDVIKKARQVAVEKAQTRRTARIRDKAAKAKTVERQAELVDKANRADPSRMTNAEVRRRVDERVAVNETIRRQNRAKATNEAADAIGNKGDGRRARVKPNAAVSLITQNITKASREDLVAYRAQIARGADGLEGSRLRANRQLRDQIDRALNGKLPLKELEAAARRYADDVIAPRQAKLVERGILDKGQAARAAVIPYAVQKMGAKRDAGGRLVGKNGRAIETNEILEHMRTNGVKAPAYVTQAPGQRGARNFYISSQRPPQIGKSGRTGEATRKGLFDADPEVLVEGAARAQGLIDAADGFTDTIKEFAARDHGGKVETFKSRKQAMDVARDRQATDGTTLRPVRLNPWAGRQDQLKALLDKADGDAPDARLQGRQPVKEALEAAIRGDDGDGPWALIPEAAADQLAQHLAKLTVGPKGKALQLGSSAFRRTVLSTSPSWLLGNVTEATFRSTIGRAGPRSYVTGRKTVKALERQDPKAAQELAARALGGGHFSMADRVHIRRDSTQFEGGRVLEPTARALGAFWRVPGPKQLASVWRGYTDMVFRHLSGRLESQFQTAMLGKALRDSPLMDGQLVKTGNKAVEEAARGLRDTNTQVQFARQVERMYGKYQAFSPDMRGLITTYTPFIAWYLNAVKFVYSVLPRDHPTVTALIVVTEKATEEWRKEHGLDLFMRDAVPGFLQGSIPTADGGKQRAPNRYLPFGAFGDPLAGAAGTVLPQASGVLAAFRGEDWKGATLRDENGDPVDTLGKAKAAMTALLDSTVPVLAQAKRVSKDGPSALNPVRPVKPKVHTRRKSVADQLKGSGSADVTRQLNSGGRSVTDQLLNP